MRSERGKGQQEDAVDVVDVNRFVGAADGLDHAADAEIAGLAQDAIGAADDEVDGGAGEGVVSESDAVEFAQDEVAHVVGIEPLGDDRVGDAALDVLVDAEVEHGEKAGRPTRTRLWFLGKSSKRSRSLRRLARSMRWASSRMVVKALPAWLRLKACSMRRRSHLKALLSNSTRKAPQRILTVLV